MDKTMTVAELRAKLHKERDEYRLTLPQFVFILSPFREVLKYEFESCSEGHAKYVSGGSVLLFTRGESPNPSDMTEVSALMKSIKAKQQQVDLELFQKDLHEASMDVCTDTIEKLRGFISQNTDRLEMLSKEKSDAVP